MKFKNKNAIILVFFHVIAALGVFKITDISKRSILFQFIFIILSMTSITGGYHRLWSHNTYQANPILQVFYLFFGTMASQNSVINWAKEHRTHHRNEEKPGDPYNINKGLFHAHIGWLLFPFDKKEEEEITKTDVSDLESNKLLAFQKKYYNLLWIVISFGFTHLIMKQWGESSMNILFSNFIRIVIVLNLTWCINSFAHYSGDKPYNKNLKASNNKLLGILTLGEGWHNYHHSYPKDYRASEPDKINFTTRFINLTKKMGLSSNHHYNDNMRIPTEERFNKKFYKVME